MCPGELLSQVVRFEATTLMESTLALAKRLTEGSCGIGLTRDHFCRKRAES